jgi:hypothetical protein
MAVSSSVLNSFFNMMSSGRLKLSKVYQTFRATALSSQFTD